MEHQKETCNTKMAQHFQSFLRPQDTLRLLGFIPHTSELYLKMVAQRGNRDKISHQIKKVFQ